MKSKFLTRFSVRVKIVAGKTLSITVMDHDTGEINVHFIDIFSGKELKSTEDVSESKASNNDASDSTSEGESSEEQVDQKDLLEEQLEEGN